MADGAPPGKQHRTIQNIDINEQQVTLQTHQITEDRGPRTEDRAPAPAEPPTRDSNLRLHDPKSSAFALSTVISLGDNYPIFFVCFMTFALADLCVSENVRVFLHYLEYTLRHA